MPTFAKLLRTTCVSVVLLLATWLLIERAFYGIVLLERATARPSQATQQTTR